jgi:putative endonuclease
MTSATDRRKQAEKNGRRAETLAQWWLRLKGFGIITQRVKTPKGEIDIIARRGRLVVFVEVKMRNDFDKAIEAVTGRQTKRIVAAAQYWRGQQKNLTDVDCRFDIILVKPYLLLKHIKNAFGESGRAV